MDNISTKVSIVIPCRNEGPNVASTVQSILETPTLLSYEIIVVDDGSSDGCCQFLANKKADQVRLIRTLGLGASNARNRGALSASGELLVFCDAHVFVEPYWLDKMAECFSDKQIGIVTPAIAPHDRPHLAGYGQTLTEGFRVDWLAHPGRMGEIPIAPGGCVMIARRTFQRVGGFDTGFRVWGHEDVELSIKYWLFGYKVLVNPEVKILHIFREQHPYPVSLYHVHYNYLRMAISHFGSVRIKKMLKLINSCPDATEIISQVAYSNVWQQRKRYFAMRKYHDDWFFHKFSIPF